VSSTRAVYDGGDRPEDERRARPVAIRFGPVVGIGQARLAFDNGFPLLGKLGVECNEVTLICHGRRVPAHDGGPCRDYKFVI